MAHSPAYARRLTRVGCPITPDPLSDAPDALVRSTPAPSTGLDSGRVPAANRSPLHHPTSTPTGSHTIDRSTVAEHGHGPNPHHGIRRVHAPARPLTSILGLVLLAAQPNKQTPIEPVACRLSDRLDAACSAKAKNTPNNKTKQQNKTMYNKGNMTNNKTNNA